MSTMTDTPIFDALLAASSAERRAVVALNLALAEHADHAWAEFHAAMNEA